VDRSIKARGMGNGVYEVKILCGVAGVCLWGLGTGLVRGIDCDTAAGADGQDG